MNNYKNFLLTDFMKMIMINLRFEIQSWHETDDQEEYIFLETHRELQMVGLQQFRRYGMDLGRWEQRVGMYRVTWVMPNGISARYQGKAHDGACGERAYIDAPN